MILLILYYSCLHFYDLIYIKNNSRIILTKNNNILIKKCFFQIESQNENGGSISIISSNIFLALTDNTFYLCKAPGCGAFLFNSINGQCCVLRNCINSCSVTSNDFYNIGYFRTNNLSISTFFMNSLLKCAPFITYSSSIGFLSGNFIINSINSSYHRSNFNVGIFLSTESSLILFSTISNNYVDYWTIIRTIKGINNFTNVNIISNSQGKTDIGLIYNHGIYSEYYLCVFMNSPIQSFFHIVEGSILINKCWMDRYSFISTNALILTTYYPSNSLLLTHYFSFLCYAQIPYTSIQFSKIFIIKNFRFELVWLLFI